MLPMIAKDFPAVEPNNRPCSAYGIATGTAYQFMPDDRNDWYYFDVDETATVTVELRGLVVSDSQFSVWDGTCTDLLTPSLGYDGAVDHPNKTIQIKNLKPGQYFIWVLNGDNIAYSTPYSLRVVVSK